MIPFLLLMPSSVLSGIVSSGQSGGPLAIAYRRAESLAVCVGAGNADGDLALSLSAFCTSFKNLDRTQGGAWFRVNPECHWLWEGAMNHGQTVPIEVFVSKFKSPYRWTSTTTPLAVLTVVAESDAPPEVRSWTVTSDTAHPTFMDEYHEGEDPFNILKPAWPVAALAGQHVSMVGLGSIGSAALNALLAYGFRKFTLVDPQRLQQRNLARHALGWRDVGRPKVAALKERLGDRFPSVEIESLALNVELAADVMRPLFAESDIVIGCPDGVVARRVVGHLARRAGAPVVFAAVLDDGRIGELLRLRADLDVGCLTCQRAYLEEEGGVEMERHIDPGYGQPTNELPMTAVGGDLALMGALTAKMALATLLEGHGYVDQRLPGNHAVIGLRPASDLREPFATVGPLDVHWRRGGPPREGCPTCGPQDRVA